MVGGASFFSSGFAGSLFAPVTPNNALPLVPPVPPREKPPVAGGAGVDVPDASDFLTPNKPAPNDGAVVEVDVEVVALSAGLGGSPKNPPVAGVIVVVDESPGLGAEPNNPPVVFVLDGPPNNPPVVVLVLGGPPNRPPDVAAEHG